MAREITYREALNEALRHEMQRDPIVISYGQDAGKWGGIFKVTAGLTEEFGEERNFDAPISETAITGGAVGMAITGLRPVPELQFADFFAIAMDEIYNKAAKWRYMHGGNFTVPVVFRMPMGVVNGAGAEHSQCPEAHFMDAFGLKVAVPSTPYDAKGLLITAIRDDNPVVFLEHKMLYETTGEVPEEAYDIPFGEAVVRREGSDVTVVTWSWMANTVLEAADQIADNGVSVEVLDPRTLVPLDTDAILDSVRKTGRLVIVHEAPKTGGAGADIAAVVAEEAIYDLKAPIRRVGAEDVPMPQSAHLEQFCIPQVNDVVTATNDVMVG